MTDRAQRPFWVHQFAEYVIGLALIAFGFQDPEPLAPAAVGVLVLLNAGVVRGPLGAFKAIGRRVHRYLDVAVVGVILFLVAQPWVAVSLVGRVTMALICIPFGFLWWYTDWDERPRRRQRRIERGSQRADGIGRSAGRLVGRGWRAAKDRLDSDN